MAHDYHSVDETQDGAQSWLNFSGHPQVVKVQPKKACTHFADIEDACIQKLAGQTSN